MCGDLKVISSSAQYPFSRSIQPWTDIALINETAGSIELYNSNAVTVEAGLEMGLIAMRN